MLIPDPESRISDPGSKNSYKREGWKKISFCSHKFHKIKNYFIFELPRKKILAKFQRSIELLPKKLSLSSQKCEFGSGIRDPGSGKNLFRIPDPGVKMAPYLDPKHCSAQLTVESTALCRLWIVFLHQHDRPDYFVILYSFVSEDTGIEP